MSKIKVLNISWKQLYVCTALIGVLVFVLIYGVHIINPTYDDWLLSGGDLSQHYIGWKMYRSDDWKFPIGLMDNLSYPNETSVIFTDSIPIFAVFFKLLSPVLPETFQYFGIWGMVCFVLQGILSSMILKEFGLTKLQICAASIMFMAAPIVIYRMYMHTSLAGQWIILWAILMLVRHKRIYNSIWRVCGCWAAIGAVAASVHIYFLPMCGIVLIGFVIASFMREKKFRLSYVYPVFTYCASAFATIYILGGVSADVRLTASGLGSLSFNLSGFFYPMGYSKTISAKWSEYIMFLRATGDQREGFAWIGLGMCVMCILAIIAFIVNCINKRHIYVSIKEYGVVYAFIIICSVVMAASPVITFGDVKLFELSVPETIEKLWSYFRSTGRLVWPAYYLIYIFCIVSTVKLMQNWNKVAIGAGSAIVILCVCIQIYDMSSVLLGKNSRFNQMVEYTLPFSSEIWEKLAVQSEYKHIVYAVHGLESADNLITFGEYASETGMTINNFYFARDVNVSWADSDCLQEDTIYLFPIDAEGLEEWKLHFYEADGYIVGTVNPVEGFYER